MKLSIGRLMKGFVVGFPLAAAAAAAGEGEKNFHSKTQALRARQLLMMMMVAMESHRGDCIGGYG